MDFFNKVIKILSKPTEFWADAEKEKGIGEAVRFLLLLTIISAVISYLVNILVIKISPEEAEIYVKILAGMGFHDQPTEIMWLTVTVAVNILGFAATFITAGVINLFVRLLKGKEGYSATFKAVAYSTTPQMLLATIPVVGFIASLYSLSLQINGISKLQKISAMRAALAYVLMFFVLTVIGIAVAFYFVSTTFPKVPSQTTFQQSTATTSIQFKN